MTAEETAIHIVSELLENGHTQTGARTKGVLSILQAITEAKEEGRTEMQAHLELVQLDHLQKTETLAMHIIGMLGKLQAAREEGRVEMREKCAQVAEAEERQMNKRMPASDVDAQYKDGYVDGAHVCAGFIRALPTDSLAEVASA